MTIRFINRHRARLVALAIAALPPFLFQVGMAEAQTSSVAAPPSSPPMSPSALPASAMAKSVPAPYRSALEGYKPYTDEKIVDWKQANDSTGKIGGWREYAKEAQQPDAADAADASAKPAPAGKPAPDARPVKP